MAKAYHSVVLGGMKRKVSDEESPDRATTAATRAHTSLSPSHHHILTTEHRGSKQMAASSIFHAKYREEKRLGDGSFGEVCAGFRKQDNFPVAIKHIPLADVERIPVYADGMEYNLPLEVALLSMVGPGCDPIGSSAAVALIDCFELEQELILIMERPVPCVDLHDYIVSSRSKSLQEDEAKVLMKQLLDAFIEIHHKGVFHRDIKPENILVHTGSDGPRIRVIDFGCGTLLEPGSTDLAGTPDYLPPEYFLYQDYEAGPVTVWQLGVVLYEMLHGAFPFGNNTEIVYKRPKISKRLRRNCRQFLFSCLTKESSHRPTLEELQNHCWLQ
ncbi:serine/threonine-protein kinase pim-2-like [Genypterus blacodes]|uniref:serine/threonine-protein kinase pim-2-like n=1 Tax=Genypterus blacodes TaxID=154954 RepID=UPI003F77777B